MDDTREYAVGQRYMGMSDVFTIVDVLPNSCVCRRDESYVLDCIVIRKCDLAWMERLELRKPY